MASFAFRPLFQISQLSLQRPDALKHEKMFATECRRRDSHKFLKVGRKPNVNVKKVAVLDFVELTFLQGEDQPHLKIYFRRREELKVRG